MNTQKIFDEHGRGFTRVISDDIVEKVNPIEYYKNTEQQKRAILFHDLLKADNPFLTSLLDESFFIKKAEESLGDFFDKLQQTAIHENFIRLLTTTRKKDQEKLLRGMSLNPDQLISLIFKSYTDYGYLYSKFLFENLPAGLEGKRFPKLFHIKEDGTIRKVGKTDLSDGDLKRIIEQRKVIVSHFIEKEGLWHCFFLTYNSIGGAENGEDGQAHFHYLSSAFGITKEDIIESMRSGRYRSTSIHIDLLDYRNKADE